MRLTDIAIRNLPVPEQGQTIHVDTTLPGFGVRVSPGGSKTFVLTYGKHRRRLTIGRYPVITLAQARDIARKHLAERTLGQHTNPPIALAALTERFLADIRPRVRPSTYKSYVWLLARISLSGNVDDITPRKMTEATDSLTPSTRSHVIAVYKILFRYALRHGYLRHNPIDGFIVRPSKARERVLTPDELKAIWPNLDGTFGAILKLLILTGQRKGEIQHITVRDDWATIAAEHTKNHRQHTFPVGEISKALLAMDRRFNGWGNAKARLDRQVAIPAWTLHDLRRTFATIHAELGTQPHVIERLLNHITGSMTPLARTYNQHKYLEEMRDAVQRYEKHLASLLSWDTP